MFLVSLVKLATWLVDTTNSVDTFNTPPHGQFHAHIKLKLCSIYGTGN